MGHGLELVVDEQLRRHHDEAKGEEEAVAGAQHEAVPSLVHGCQRNRLDFININNFIYLKQYYY